MEEFHRDIYAPPIGSTGRRIERASEDEEEMALFRQAAGSLK